MFNDEVARALAKNRLLSYPIGKEDAIEHYGRPGMKWGIRRTKKQLASADKAAGSKGGKKNIKKQAKKMSDEDLKKAVNRMNLEKRYVDLSTNRNAKTKTRMQRGKSEMAKIAKKSARKAVQAQADLAVANAVDKGLNIALKRDAT